MFSHRLNQAEVGVLSVSTKTKIVVLHLKEVIYTAIFAALAIVLIILLVVMFGSDKDKKTSEAVSYTAGVYTQSIMLNDQMVNVQVIVDKDKIKSISLENLDDEVAALYPLMQPALDNLSQQIYEKQSLEDITYSDDSKYTSEILLQAIQAALDKAKD